jgi:hypothetical protein
MKAVFLQIEAVNHSALHWENSMHVPSIFALNSCVLQDAKQK